MIYKARAVYIGARRTTVRLAPVMWEALDDIARDQSLTLSDVLCKIEHGCDPGEGLADAIRIYIVKFYRERFRL
jgi:predicted DNA-binding ribbon-helix-helix protein